MRNSLSAGKNSATLFRRFERRALPIASIRRLRLHRRADEAGEKRMRPRWAGLQLRMELAPDVPWMGLKLDHLDERSVGGKPAQIQPVLDELIAVLVVHFIPVSMALTYLRHAVNAGGLSAVPELARVCSESHRAAHI